MEGEFSFVVRGTVVRHRTRRGIKKGRICFGRIGKSSGVSSRGGDLYSEWAHGSKGTVKGSGYCHNSWVLWLRVRGSKNVNAQFENREKYEIPIKRLTAGAFTTTSSPVGDE